MSKIRVAVLRGGPSSEYEVSLKSGSSVLANLPAKYKSIDVLIDKNGVWHAEGVPVTPDVLASKIDVAFNAMHGEYGEDGKVQKILEHHNIPFTGSGSFASSVGMNKELSKDIFKQHGIKTAHHVVIDRKDVTLEKVYELFRTFPHPAIVKPITAGSSLGVSIVNRFEDLGPALYKAFEISPRVLLEEFIPGKEATVGVVDNFRGEGLYSLLPVEIRKPSSKQFFDYDAKYTGISEEVCPGNFTEEEKLSLQQAARAIHNALGLRHYSRSDFIINPRRGVYALEVNTLPGLTEESLLPKSLHAIGSNLGELIDHLITLAIEHK